MKIQDYLGDDGQVLLALCSSFGLPNGGEQAGLATFKLAEWNQLAAKIAGSSFQSPSRLQGQSADALAGALAIASEEAERIARLLDRVGRLTLELESLFSRGLWVVTRVDPRYPDKLRDTLKHQAPTVLFGAGETQLLRRAGLAIIGSRNIDEAGAAFAKEAGRKAVSGRLAVVSGGARGTDRIAMEGAMEAGGVVIGALADSLEATVRKADVRQLLLESRLALVTPYAPTAGFSVGAAMGRNKVIYGLSEFSVVVASDYQTGGTWAGAVEALKAGWCPVFVREGDDAPKGNRELQKLGALPLTSDELGSIEDLPTWMRDRAIAKPVERDLFGWAVRETVGGKG
jgi:predicted Rossmann fold nucleotide-binding protein DprA/Smf involved in DNA uptake